MNKLILLSCLPLILVAGFGLATDCTQGSSTARSPHLSFSSAVFKAGLRSVVVAAVADNNFDALSAHHDPLSDFNLTLSGFASCYGSPDPKKGDAADKTVQYVCNRFFMNKDDADKFYATIVAASDEVVGNGTFRPVSTDQPWTGMSVELGISAASVGALQHKCYGIDDTHFIVQLSEVHDLIKVKPQDPIDYSVSIRVHQKHAALPNCK